MKEFKMNFQNDVHTSYTSEQDDDANDIKTLCLSMHIYGIYELLLKALNIKMRKER